jgi:hypothetical protein
MSELREKGVQFSPKIAEEGALRIAPFKDPDNDSLYLAQMQR